MDSALITNIQGFSIHDGPGIRTVVFIKGCSLECRWCSNPECISPRPEIGLMKNVCTKCGRCIGICPESAIVGQGGQIPSIDRRRCNGCGACVDICTYRALILYGKEMTADEVFDIIARDKMFYEASGGGLTVSGGEPLLQPNFVANLFERCRKAGIHTCIETSGCCTGVALRQVLPLTDQFLFDLKVMDRDKHLKYTGMINDRILSNARLATAGEAKVLFRMPLLPGINDDARNIQDTADFIRGLQNNAAAIELMPYHPLGKGKYESLEREYHLPDLAVPESDHLEAIRQAFENRGIKCSVSR